MDAASDSCRRRQVNTYWCVSTYKCIWVCLLKAYKRNGLECITRILSRVITNVPDFHVITPAPDYLCARKLFVCRLFVFQSGAEEPRSIAFTILGKVYGDCLLICKWRAICQVRNISRWCCWFQTCFYLLWAENHTTQAVCSTRTLLIS